MKIKFFFGFILSISTFSCFAQDISSKDKVIEQLMLNPKDTILWECYIGKSWNSMNIYEKEQCEELSIRYAKNLKEQIEKNKITLQEIETASFDSEVDSIESTATKLLSNDMLKQEKELQQNAKKAAEESIAELKELSQNMKKNLPIIEDWIQKKAEDLNLEYQKIDSENGEEVLAWIKMYGQKIYTTTYKDILENNGSKGE